MNIYIMHESFADEILAKHPNARINDGYVVTGYRPPNFDGTLVDLTGEFKDEDDILSTEQLTATVDGMLIAEPVGNLVVISEEQASYLNANHSVFIRDENNTI